MKPSDNPIVEIYKGVPIRKYPDLRIAIDVITAKQIIDIQKETNLSTRKILSYSARPCDCCTGVNVVVCIHDKNIEIPRGILSKRIGNDSGKKRKIH